MTSILGWEPSMAKMAGGPILGDYLYMIVPYSIYSMPFSLDTDS